LPGEAAGEAKREETLMVGDEGGKAGSIVIPEGFGLAAEKLADTIRHVVDLAVPAKRIVAKAQAQADSELILAKGRAEVAELEARTVDRLRRREFRRQHNIESIALKAVPHLPPPEQIGEERPTEDWISRFFEECQDISDEQMQQIWARLLAGEVARPGTFAPRTLSIVRDLTKLDVEIFSSLGRFFWNLPKAPLAPIIYDHQEDFYQTAGLTFAKLMHLMAIGLIEFDSGRSFFIQGGDKVVVSYFGERFLLESSSPGNPLDIGHVILTSVGIELSRLAHGEPDHEFKERALRRWEQFGWKRGPG
jgi:hypothetical protein